MEGIEAEIDGPGYEVHTLNMCDLISCSKLYYWSRIKHYVGAKMEVDEARIETLILEQSKFLEETSYDSNYFHDFIKEFEIINH